MAPGRGRGVIREQHGGSRATQPPGTSIEIVEGNQIGVDSRLTDRRRSEYDVVIQATGRRAQIKGKLGGKHIRRKPALHKDAPVQLVGAPGGGNLLRVDPGNDGRIAALPPLDRLMEDLRLLVNHVGMLQQRIAAEYDVALRPVLRSTDVGTIRGFLGRKTRCKKQESDTHNCNSAIM